MSGFLVNLALLIKSYNSYIMATSLSQITPENLRTRLHAGIVKFFFVKLDGSLRECMATTKLTHIPADQHPQGVRESSDAVVVFWDLLVGRWRSANIRSQLFIKE